MGPFWLFGANFGVGVSFKNIFGVYLCSWTTFIFYTPVNSDFLFWPNFGVGFWFLGHQWAVFWNWGFEKYVLGVYSSGLTTFIFYALSDSCSKSFWTRTHAPTEKWHIEVGRCPPKKYFILVENVWYFTFQELFTSF